MQFIPEQHNGAKNVAAFSWRHLVAEKLHILPKMETANQQKYPRVFLPNVWSTDGFF